MMLMSTGCHTNIVLQLFSSVVIKNSSLMISVHVAQSLMLHMHMYIPHKQTDYVHNTIIYIYHSGIFEHTYL